MTYFWINHPVRLLPFTQTPKDKGMEITWDRWVRSLKKCIWKIKWNQMTLFLHLLTPFIEHVLIFNKFHKKPCNNYHTHLLLFNGVKQLKMLHPSLWFVCVSVGGNGFKQRTDFWKDQNSHNSAGIVVKFPCRRVCLYMAFQTVAIEGRGWFLLITSQKDSYSYKMCGVC